MKFTVLRLIFCLAIFSTIAVSQSKTAAFDNNAANLTRPRKTPEAVVNNALTADLEARIFALINQKRIEINLPPLVWSDEAAKVARLHTNNMAVNKFFSHQGLDGKMVNERADALGFRKWRAIGENIAFNRGFKLPIESAVEQWLKSASHRENLLDARWHETGIGAAIAADGTYYFTQVFIVRK